MNKSPKIWLTTLALVAVSLFATPQQAQATVPVIDMSHIAVSTQNAATSVANWTVNALHEVKDAASWITDYIQQQMQSGLLGYILSVNEIMQVIQDEIMNAAGTVADIVAIPSTIMEDLFGMIGSVKDTIMSVAGVAGVFEDIQGVFTGISEAEAFGQNFMSMGSELMDFGSFGNAYGAYSAVRGVQARTSIEQLKMVDQDRQSVERIINTFENSDNQAEIAKGTAQLTAAIHRELGRGNELAAINTQKQVAESWSREASARARASAAQASAADVLINSLE